jgi:beta-alanine--pyruvate transaminase
LRSSAGLTHNAAHRRRPSHEDRTMTLKPNSLEEHWMPFTANKHFKQEPRLFVEAKGVYLKNHRGESLIDGSSGLYCVPAGHGRKEIADAVHKQLMELDFSPPFQFGHPLQFEVARRVAELTPGDLDYVFFANSGSEAVDSAMKMCIQYHRARGQSQRTRFVCREKAYHGVNFGGTSLSGLVKNRESFGPLLAGISHIRHTRPPEHKFVMGQADTGADLADDLQRHVELYGADNIAACFIEPVAGSVGILPPPKGYLQKIREICDRHGILLVFDEVICGFGRIGGNFGAQALGVTPDLITMAKALTNGVIPMGAVAASKKVYDAITESGPAKGIEFFHGYTYSGIPAACAASIASLDIYKKEGLFERAREMTPYFLEQISSLREFDIVTDTRGIGLLGAIDMTPYEGKPGARGYDLLQDLFNNGLLVRITYDTLILAPQFVCEKKHIDEIFDKVRGAIRRNLARPSLRAVS